MGYRTQLFRAQPYPVPVSTEAAVAVAHPRRAVIDRAWRAIGPGVEVLSGHDGGPLRRTVKRVLDPLVLRFRSYPSFRHRSWRTKSPRRCMMSSSAREPSCAAAAWFELLKRERRRLRITSGNAQELYFPVCFELAVTKGLPAQPDSGAAESVLRDVHADRDRTAIEVLNAYASDGFVNQELSDHPVQARTMYRPERRSPVRSSLGSPRCSAPPTLTAPQQRGSGSGTR